MEDLTFQKPDKYDGMPGRVALVSHEVSLRLPHAVMVSEVGQKDKRAMLFKTDVAACTQVAQLDQRIVDITKQNVRRWFDNKLSDATLDAMYVACVTGSQRVRVCVSDSQSHRHSQEFAGASDIVLALKGICFEPHSFYPMWTIARAAPSSLFLEDDNDAAATPMPTRADARRIRHTIREKLSAEAEHLRARLERVQTSMDKLQATSDDDDIRLLLAFEDNDARA